MLIRFNWTPSSSELDSLSRCTPFTCLKSFKFQIDSNIEHEISFWSLELYLQPVQRGNDKITFKLRLEDTAIAKYLQAKFHITLKSKQGTLLCQVKKLYLFKKSSDELSETGICVQTGFFRGSHHFPFEIVCNISTNIENDIVRGTSEVIPDFEKILDDKQFSDFTVITSTNKKFHVHKNILAARSDVFSVMFNSDMVEKKNNSMTIHDFDDEIIQELLRYIYCGRIQNLEKISSSLLKAAEKYLLKGLKIMCLEQMCDAVTFENAIELFCLTIDYKVDYLKSQMFNFIVYNIKHIDKTNLNYLDKSSVQEILLKTVETHLCSINI